MSKFINKYFLPLVLLLLIPIGFGLLFFFVSTNTPTTYEAAKKELGYIETPSTLNIHSAAVLFESVIIEYDTGDDTKYFLYNYQTLEYIITDKDSSNYESIKNEFDGLSKVSQTANKISIQSIVSLVIVGICTIFIIGIIVIYFNTKEQYKIRRT